jgi:transposase-like protein
MDPSTTFCPNPACPAKGQQGRGNIGIHRQKKRRYRCTTCRKTCAATRGTAL